jgi:protein-S-isoprenylcysteine O-methyltransferase Ste14
MRAVELTFAIGWAAFWLYWLTAAISTKGVRVTSSHRMLIRLVLVVALVLVVHTGIFKGRSLHTNSGREIIGLVLLVAGLSFAVWARLHIGKNWGVPMSQKADPDLITSGPYHLVRHPIYTGILTAGIGTAVALSWVWLIVVAISGAYFIYSATNEERYMTTQFPDAYPAYKRSSKMLIPFIF